MIRFRESFETQDQTRWGASGTAQYGSGGRGTGHLGSLSYSGSFTNHCTADVPAASTYGACIAAQTPASPTGTFLVLMRFKEQAGTNHITIMFNASGYVEVRKGIYNGTLLATSTSVIRSNGNYQHAEGKVKVHSTLGSVEVRIDQIPVVFDNPLTNINTNNGGAGQIDRVLGGDPDGGVRSGVNFDDFVVWDTTGTDNNDFLGDVRVGYSAANASGTHSDGTASNASTLLSCVQDVPSNGDSNYVILDGTTLPQNVSMNVENAPSNILSILEVAPIAIVRKDDAGADTGRLVLVSGGTDYDGGVDVAVPSSYTAVQRGYERNPATGNKWTSSEFNSHEVGFRRTA